MDEIKKEELLKQIKDLKQINELPELFIANYFSDLRNKADKEILSKQLNLKAEDEKFKELNEKWKELISKIDSNEHHYINNKFETNIETIKTIETIETMLNNQQNINMQEIKDAIDNEEYHLLKKLFQNKTIIFFDYER